MCSQRAPRDFLISCSESMILDHGQSVEHKSKETDLQDIVMVRLSSLLLKNVQKLGCCRSLRICILADNFIAKIDALVECVHLVKLDLKGNQIKQLPDAVFWSQLKELQLLNLHDNSMSTQDNITGLSGCSRLSALTLYNTPVSLKGQYRHFLVNVIWSLKALDNYVISDEEIIEDRHQPMKFKSKSRHFYVNLYPASKADSFKTEIKTVHQIIAKINRIQAMYSPTLIIQRWIRGYLTRKKLGIRQSRAVRSSNRLKEQLSASFPVGADWGPTASSKAAPKECIGVKVNQHVHIPKIFQEAMHQISTDKKKQKNQHPLFKTPQNSKILKSDKVKLNEFVKGMPIDITPLYFYNDDPKNTNICVFGLKAMIHPIVPRNHVVFSRQVAARHIHETTSLLHNMKQRPCILPPCCPPMVTIDKSTMGCSPGSICRTQCQATKKVYEDLKNAEERRLLTGRKEQVAQSWARREEARTRRLGLMEARRTEALRRHERDQAELEDSLRTVKASHIRKVQEVQQKYALFLEEKRRLATEEELLKNFIRQHASLEKAIMKHKTCKRLFVDKQENSNQVIYNKQQAKPQRLLTQSNRKTSVQEESIELIESGDSHLASKHNYRRSKSDTRVSSSTATHSKVKDLQVDPVSQTT
ncbi:uncharacterized protein lrriq3 [Chanos chanos]|uniref:Uncharacterized protein lrriq3 n=1 Tax=Chanos chanos TaxID=29144 RepID=A0A6J2W7J6_CHACN|nr:leucine-rich repeat and IQ domain-containing protein 3 [Chanos chanos]